MLQENSQFNLKCLSVELWRKKDINKNMEFSDWIYYSIIENIKATIFLVYIHELGYYKQRVLKPFIF